MMESQKLAIYGCFIAVCICGGSARAQVNEPPFPSEPKSSRLNQFRDTIKGLKDTTEKVKMDRPSEPTRTPMRIWQGSGGSGSKPNSNSFGEGAENGSNAELDHSKQLDAIRERLGLIRKMRRQKFVSTNPQTPPANPFRGSSSNTAPPVPSVESGATAPTALPSMQDQATANPTLDAIQANIQGTAQDESGQQTEKDKNLKAEAVVNTPVNKLELAQSLFQTKNYTAALQAIDSIEREQLADSDNAWLELLAALCHRRLGQQTDFESILREISNAKAGARATSVARNWLKQSEITEDTRAATEQVFRDVEILSEKVRNYEK